MYNKHLFQLLTRIQYFGSLFRFEKIKIDKMNVGQQIFESEQHITTVAG